LFLAPFKKHDRSKLYRGLIGVEAGIFDDLLLLAAAHIGLWAWLSTDGIVGPYTQQHMPLAPGLHQIQQVEPG
jgi:hypothetical protein